MNALHQLMRLMQLMLGTLSARRGRAAMLGQRTVTSLALGGREVVRAAPVAASSSTAPATLIIGAAGAVGKRLCAALTAQGKRVIASDRMPSDQMPGSLKRSIGPHGTCVGGVDVCDADALRVLFRDHADEHTTVWNLAAPLSVETAMDPAVRERPCCCSTAPLLRAGTRQRRRIRPCDRRRPLPFATPLAAAGVTGDVRCAGGRGCDGGRDGQGAGRDEGSRDAQALLHRLDRLLRRLRPAQRRDRALAARQPRPGPWLGLRVTGGTAFTVCVPLPLRLKHCLCLVVSGGRRGAAET